MHEGRTRGGRTFHQEEEKKEGNRCPSVLVELGTVAHVCNSSRRRLMHEDRHKFKASVGHLVSS